MKYQNRILFVLTGIIASSTTKTNAAQDNHSILDLSDSTYLRSSGLTVEKKREESIDQNKKRALKVATTKLFEAATNALGNDDSFLENKLVASDGAEWDRFGKSCSMSNDIIVIGAPYADNSTGAVYLFDLNGNETKKLTPNDDGDDRFGLSVSIDEKIVVGTGVLYGGYVQVFSSEGIRERTITCDDCINFGTYVVTHGENIVIADSKKLLIFTTAGELMKKIERDRIISDLAISSGVIVSTASDGKTVIFNNTAPDFPKIAIIEQGGESVAVSGDRLVIGHSSANDGDGGAWLYSTNGTLIKTLEHDSRRFSYFGNSVGINDDKVIVGARNDGDDCLTTGSIFIYSTEGEFIEKKLAPDGSYSFGYSVCASNSHYVVGAPDSDDCEYEYYAIGAAYLFPF